MESIVVGYKKITAVGTGGIVLYHKYIIYTDTQGRQFYARGGPGLNPLNNPLQLISPMSLPAGDWAGPSPFGDIKTEHGEYTRNTVD